MASRSKTSTPESSDYAPDLLLSQSSRAPAPLRSSSAPVFSQPLSFSISRILGLEDNARQLQSTASLIPAHDDSIPEVPGDQCQGTGSNDKCRQISEHSPNVDSDNPSTDVHSGRESDTGRLSPSSAERPRKRKQRTTFSPIEVLELEKVFSERPYLIREDEDRLVQKLGLTTRNVRIWFQNRRNKLRRQEKASNSFPRTGFQNQLDQSTSPSFRELQFGSPAYPTHASFQRPPPYPNHVKYSPYTPEQAPCPCCPIKSNRFPPVDARSQSHRDFLKYLSGPYAEPSTSMGRHWPNQVADGQQSSRNYQRRWVIGIREDEAFKTS